MKTITEKYPKFPIGLTVDEIKKLSSEMNAVSKWNAETDLEKIEHIEQLALSSFSDELEVSKISGDTLISAKMFMICTFWESRLDKFSNDVTGMSYEDFIGSCITDSPLFKN